MRRSEYAGLLRIHSREKYGDSDEIRLWSRAGVLLVEAAVLDYQYDFVDEILAAHSKETSIGSREDAIWKGDALRLSGDALAAQARWQESWHTYRRARNAYARGKDGSICHSRWVTTHASMANVALDSGGFSDANMIVDSLDSAEEMSRYATSIEMSQVLRVQARNMTVESLRSACRSENDSPIVSLEEFHAAALSWHENLGLGRYVPILKYDMGCDLLLCGKMDEAQTMFEAQASVARDIGEFDTALVYYLGLIKIRIMKDRADLRDISRCIRIGRKFRDICHMPNRYADALGTAYVVAIRRGAPSQVVDSLREVAESSYVTLGKTWKFELLKKAESGDFREVALFLP